MIPWILHLTEIHLFVVILYLIIKQCAFIAFSIFLELPTKIILVGVVQDQKTENNYRDEKGHLMFDLNEDPSMAEEW